mgnify:FL=1
MLNIFVIILVIVIAFLLLLFVRKYCMNNEKKGGNEDVAKFWYLLDGIEYGQGILYIPESDFEQSIDEILKKYNAHVELEEESQVSAWGAKSVSRREWLLEYSKQNVNNYKKLDSIIKKYSHVQNLGELSILTKNIILKFVPEEDMPLDYKNYYHCKGDEINKRIISFNHLRNVVLSNPTRFSNIKFPKRYLVVKKKNYNTILNRNELLKYIDDNFRLVISATGEISWSIANPDYTIIVCSTLVKPNAHPFKLSTKAKEQIIDLLSQTPFDTSYNTGGNIFAVGDEAWIVDGKNKGGSSSEMIKNILAI